MLVPFTRRLGKKLGDLLQLFFILYDWQILSPHMGTSHAYGAADHASFRAELLVLFQAFSHGLVFDWGSAPSQPQSLSVAQQKQTFVPSAEGVLTLRRMRLVVAAAHMYLSWTPDGSRTPFCATLAKRLQRSLDDAAARRRRRRAARRRRSGGRAGGGRRRVRGVLRKPSAGAVALARRDAPPAAPTSSSRRSASKSSELSPPSSGNCRSRRRRSRRRLRRRRTSPPPPTPSRSTGRRAPAGITTFGVPTAPSVPLVGALSPRGCSARLSARDLVHGGRRRVGAPHVVSEIGPLRGETELSDDILLVPSADSRRRSAASPSARRWRRARRYRRADRATPAE